MKVIFFDTESTALDGSWGRLLCTSFITLDGDEPYTFRKDVRPWSGRNRISDERLAVATRNELQAADMIVGWNSIRHDVPLLNARLLAYGEEPLSADEKHGIMHLDLMYYAGGNSMNIGTRRLDNVSKFFDTSHEKTALDGETWQLAAAGDTSAMDDIVEHCEMDVVVLKELWPKLAGLVKKHQFTLSEVWPFLEQVKSRKK